MNKIIETFRKHIVIVCIGLFTLIIFFPVFIKGEIPFSSNLLVSFFNPWAMEKFPGWEQGIPNKPVGIDDLRIFYPQRFFTTQTFHILQIPLWDPYIFSGNYHVGLSETGVFYPPTILFLFLPQLFVWVLFIMSEPFLAALGMYLFLSILLKEKKSAFFGAITFGLSGVVLVRMVEGLSVGHTLLWLPFAFWSIEAFFQSKRVRYIAYLLISLSFSLLAGWFQFTFYIVVFSCIYSLYKLFSIKDSSRHYLLIFLPFFLLPLVTLFHLLPSLQTFLVSPRGTFSKGLLQMHLMPIAHIATLLFPDLWGNPGAYNFFGKSEYKESIVYIGVVPFLISLFSLRLLKVNKTILFFAISILVSFVLATDNVISRFFVSLPIPLVSSFLPNRILLIASFSLSVLAGFGMREFIERKISLKDGLILLFPMTLITLLSPVTVFIFSYLRIHSNLDDNFHTTLTHITSDRFFSIQEKNLIPSMLFLFLWTILVCVLLKKRKIFLIFIMTVLFTFFGQFYFAQKYIPWSYKQFVFPQNPVFSYLQAHAGFNRFISTQEGYIPSNMPLPYKLFSPDGVSSMYSQRYGELLTYVKSHGKTIRDVPRIESRIDPAAVTVFQDQDQFLLRFMTIDGVVYVVQAKNATGVPAKVITDSSFPHFQQVWENSAWKIFQYNDSLPRFFWTNKYVVVKGDKILQTLFDNSFDPHSLVLEENPNVMMNQNGSGTVTLLSYTPNVVSFKSDAKTNGLVYLSDEYSPYFKVKVDGKVSKLLRADYDFRAVSVPKGVHVINFYYDTSIEYTALLISGGTIVIFSIVFFALIKKKMGKW